jgi:aspartate/glutamate racemase
LGRRDAALKGACLDELCGGWIEDCSRAAVILGCTEISMLLAPPHCLQVPGEMEQAA